MVSESSSSLATSHEVDAVSSLDETLGDEESSSSVAEGVPNAVVSLLSRLNSPDCHLFLNTGGAKVY